MRPRKGYRGVFNSKICVKFLNKERLLPSFPVLRILKKMLTNSLKRKFK